MRAAMKTLLDYVRLIKSFNHNELAFYPGSPKIAEYFLRRQDKGWFFELHPKDLLLLQQNMQGKKSLRVRGENGFKRAAGVSATGIKTSVCLDGPSL